MAVLPHLPRRKLRRQLEAARVDLLSATESGQSWSLGGDFSPILRGLRDPLFVVFLADEDLSSLAASRVQLFITMNLRIPPSSPAIILTQGDIPEELKTPDSSLWFYQHYPSFIDR